MAKSSKNVFRTHSNYISALRYVALGGKTKSEAEAFRLIASRLSESGWLNDLQKEKADHFQLHRSLNNAWGIEALYKMSELFIKEDDLVRLSNNWSIVQCYYVLYYLTQVFAICEGYRIPVTHPQVQRVYYFIVSSKSSVMCPWSVWYDKDGFHNVPPDSKIDNSIHSWRRVDETTALSLYCKALRTTREEYVQEALAKRKERLASKSKSETVRLSNKQKRQTEVRVRPVTLLSYLFRLKSNTIYERSSMLSAGPENIYQSTHLRENIRHIIDTSLLIAETLTATLVGKDTFHSWCRELNDYKPPAFNETGPAYRASLIRDIL